MIENRTTMNETQLRAKANALIYTLKDMKIISVFQSLLDNANSIEQIMIIFELVESYNKSKDESVHFFRKAILLGQANINLSAHLQLFFVASDVARLFFKSRKVSIKSTVEKQQILETRRDKLFSKF